MCIIYNNFLFYLYMRSPRSLEDRGDSELIADNITPIFARRKFGNVKNII